MKTAFYLPSGVNKDFIRNLIWQDHQFTADGVSKYAMENTCAEVFFKQSFKSAACNFIKRETPTQVFSCEIIFSSKRVCNLFFEINLQ